MANKVIWWEKTVEYNFLLRFLSGDGGREVWPLGGNAELMGDGIYSLDKVRWGLFEFKRNAASLSSEIVKFAVETEECKKAARAVKKMNSQLAQSINVQNTIAGSTDKGVTKNADASSSLVKIEDTLKAARAELESIQLGAFKSARDFFESEYTGPSCHFLIYGDHDRETHSLILYSRPYFNLLDEPDLVVQPGEHDNRDTRVEDKVDENLMLWDKKHFGAYLRYFMNFKLYGNSAGNDSDEGSGAASGEASNRALKEWKIASVETGDSPTYIIGVDSTKIIIAPLDDSPATKDLVSFFAQQTPTLTSKHTV